MRQRVERTIVRRVILDVLAAGYSINVNNGGDTEELPAPSRSAKEVLGAMFATDDEYLILYQNGKRIGWVWFVYGNGGWDVVSDYSTNLEPVMKGSSDLADKYS
jgi:hypothetical protein